MDKKKLHAIAEEKLLHERQTNKEDLKDLSIENVRTIIHDLKVHQIELEMQNDELMRIQNELDLAKARYFDIYDLAPEGYIIMSENGIILESNLTAASMFGFKRKDLQKQRFSQFIFIDDEDIFYLHRKSLFETKEPNEFNLRININDGSKMWCHIKATLVEENGVPFCRMIISDITEQINALKKLEESENQLEIFFQQSLTGFFIMMLDEPVYWNDTVNKEEVLDYIFEHQRCTRVNQAMLDQYGINLEDYLHKTPNEFFAHNIQQGRDAWREMLDKKLIRTYTDEKRADGSKIYIEGDYVCMYDSLGRFTGHFGNQQDISAYVQKQRKIEFISNHDYLTGLHNRRYYFAQFHKHDNPEFYPLGIMMFDVNGLKIINDAFGHEKGDVALKMFSDVLKNTFAEKDTVSRIGGDEFAALLPNSNNNNLQAYKDQIVSQLKTLKIDNIELSLAIGYQLKNSKDEDIDDLLKVAENLMYRHKSTEGANIRNNAINAILETLTNKYEIERVHSQKVSYLCKLVGEHLKLRPDEINELEQGGLFHDIGKISIPDSILKKTGKLTIAEYDIIKTHTEVGYQILRAADEFSNLATLALSHHERWDGMGYPNGLKGEDIPLFSRIISVVDAYEAMTSDRTYRKKMSQEYAISEMKRCSGTQFDPKITKIFIDEVLTKQH